MSESYEFDVTVGVQAIERTSPWRIRLVDTCDPTHADVLFSIRGYPRAPAHSSMGVLFCLLSRDLVDGAVFRKMATLWEHICEIPLYHVKSAFEECGLNVMFPVTITYEELSCINGTRERTSPRSSAVLSGVSIL